MKANDIIKLSAAYRAARGVQRKSKKESAGGPFGFPTVEEARQIGREYAESKKPKQAAKKPRPRKSPGAAKPIIFGEDVKRGGMAGGGPMPKTPEQVLNEWNVSQGYAAPFKPKPTTVVNRTREIRDPYPPTPLSKNLMASATPVIKPPPSGVKPIIFDRERS